MPLTGTLIQVLTAPNPTLDRRYQPTGDITQSQLYEPLEEHHLSEWLDFTYENIKAAYGHLFKIGPIHSNAIQDLRGTPSEIEEEAHVDDVVVLWNWRICRCPIKRGAAVVQTDLGIKQRDVTMRHLGHESEEPRSNAIKIPNWCILLRDSQNPDDGARTVTVCGDTKCNSRWKSDPALIPVRFRSNWIWPFRQVLTCCVGNATRYGYVLTPEEIVVLRVYEDESTPNAKYRVQYASVPWANSGDGVLTVNLVI